MTSAKESAFRKVVQATMLRDRQHGPVIELNRISVKKSQKATSGGGAGAAVGPSTSVSGGGGNPGGGGCKPVFLQMVGKMHLLGQEALLLPHRIWKVKFIGESVDDCGGGYSESIAEMCDELQVNKCLILFTPLRQFWDVIRKKNCNKPKKSFGKLRPVSNFLELVV